MPATIQGTARRRRAGRRLWLGALLLTVLAAGAGAERLIPLKGIDDLRVAEGLKARKEQAARVAERLGPEKFARRQPGEGERDGVVRIMALRLGFRTNRHPQWNTVPVDGKFMAAHDSIPAWMTRVDPPPHDKAYFDAHMRALAEYYRIQSYGKAIIEWEVLPEGQDEIFLLPDLADYGPAEMEDEEDWTVELLEAFVRTALDSIDATLQADPAGARFADFDAVLLFHAGSDWQNDINRDSPNDLPSFNIFFGDSLGPHPVDGGDTLIESVLVLPETNIQDVEEGDALGALNATLAHENAHQFDLADTYNTWYFWPVVGYWDLMDSGHQIVSGLQKEEDGELVEFYVYGALPASLGMWHKQYTGWVNEAEGSLRRMGGGLEFVDLMASGLQQPGLKALRVDLSDSEYILLENRQELLTENIHYIEQDDETGVIMYVADWDTEENTGEYDLFAPQSGLLAWHVDQRDMDYLFANNIVNLDGDWHVWLEEASGVHNLGNPYSWDWRGTAYDPFYTGNNTVWGATTVPDTRLKDGTASGFTLDHLETSPYLDQELGPFDEFISFRVRLEGTAPGFPRDDGGLFAGKLDHRPAGNTLMPFGDDGLAYWMAALEPDSTTRSYALAAGAGADTPVQQPLLSLPGFPLSSARLDDFIGGEDHWFVFTGEALHAYILGEDGLEEAGLAAFPLPLEEPLLAGPCAGPGFMAWLDAAGNLNLLSARGELSRAGHRDDLELEAWSPPSLFEGPLGRRVALQHDDQIWFLLPQGGEQVEEAIDLPEGQSGHAWLRSLDVDGDGQDEIFRIGRDGHVMGWSLPPSWDGMPGGETLIADWRAPLGGDSLATGPALGDMDGDGRPELFLATDDAVWRLTPRGGLFTDWPLRLVELAYLDPPMELGSSIILADMSGDGLSELCLMSQTGHVLVADENARPLLGTPRSLAGEAPLDLWADAGRLRALSWEGYRLGLDGDLESGPAEWSLAGGGPGRGGRWQRLQSLDPQDASPGAGEDWILYPNPAGERAWLHHPGLEAGLELRVELFDLEGQRLLEDEGVSPGGPWQLELDLRGLASGVYLLRFEAGEGDARVEGVRRLGVLR